MRLALGWHAQNVKSRQATAAFRKLFVASRAYSNLRGRPTAQWRLGVADGLVVLVLVAAMKAAMKKRVADEAEAYFLEKHILAILGTFLGQDKRCAARTISRS